jgi:hypothetical protein
MVYARIIYLFFLLYFVVATTFADWYPANPVVYKATTNINGFIVYTNKLDGAYHTNFNAYGDVIFKTFSTTNYAYSPRELAEPFLDIASMLNSVLSTNSQGSAAIRIIADNDDWYPVNSNLVYTTNITVNTIYTNRLDGAYHTNFNAYADVIYKTFNSTSILVNARNTPYSDELSAWNGITYTNESGVMAIRYIIDGLSDAAFAGGSVTNIYIRKDIDDTVAGDLTFAGNNVISNIGSIYINNQLIVNQASQDYNSIFYDSNGDELLYIDAGFKSIGIGMQPLDDGNKLHIGGSARITDSISILSNLFLVNGDLTNSIRTDASGNLMIE